MVPTLGRFLILLALLVASAGALVGFASGARPSVVGWAWARRLAYAFSALMALANLVMEYALLTHDFRECWASRKATRT
jgi:cytochrome c-type biogenesis protein CcmF